MEEGKEVQIYEETLPVSAGDSLDAALERMERLEKYAKKMVESKCFPQIKTVEQCMVILQKTAELDLKPTVGLSQIYVVNGQATTMGQTLLGLMQRAGFVFKQHTKGPNGATVTGRHPIYTDNDYVTSEFSKEDAVRAGLLEDKSHTWGKYIKDMMFWRAVGRFAKEYAGAVISGLVLAEEVGLPVKITESGEQVIDGEIELAPPDEEIPCMAQDQLEEFMRRLPGEEKQLLFCDYLFDLGSVSLNEAGFPSLGTLMEPVARDYLNRWDEILVELSEFSDKQKADKIDPETYKAFRNDLLEAGYTLSEVPEEGSQAAQDIEDLKTRLEALIKEKGFDIPKLKVWFNEETKRFAGKIGKNQFKKLAFGETSDEVLRDILNTAEQWIPLAKKAGLEKAKPVAKKKKTPAAS